MPEQTTKDDIKEAMAEVLAQYRVPPPAPVPHAELIGIGEIKGTLADLKSSLERQDLVLSGMDKRLGALETTETVRDKFRDTLFKVIGIILTITLFFGGVIWGIVQYLLPKK
jgi:hypothetical protein